MSDRKMDAFVEAQGREIDAICETVKRENAYWAEVHAAWWGMPWYKRLWHKHWPWSPWNV